MQVQELNEELQAAKESTKAARGRENTLKEEVDGLNQDLQRSQKTQRRLQAEKEEREQEIQELKQQIKRLSSALQVIISMDYGITHKITHFQGSMQLDLTLIWSSLMSLFLLHWLWSDTLNCHMTQPLSA